MILFSEMERTRGGLIRNRGRGRGQGSGRNRGRGRGREVQSDRVRLVELANISTSGRALPQALSPSSTSVGNEKDDIPNVRTDSL